MILNDFNLEKEKIPYFIVICIFTLIILIKMLQFQMSGGVSSPDCALYLINALNFAGIDYYHISFPNDIHYNPIICFLTSILFRLGFVDKFSICLVSAAFSFLGNIGFYIFLRYKFSPILSLLGTVILSSFSISLIYLAGGLTDLPSVSISIWILIFTIVAINKNPKYYVCILPLLVIGFFTRYTVGYIFPVIICYYIMHHNCLTHLNNLFRNKSQLKEDLKNYLKSQEFKYIIISVCLALFLFLIFSILILSYGGQLNFVEQTLNTANSDKYTPSMVDYTLDKLYYFKVFSNALFDESRILNTTLSVLLYAIILFGCVLTSIDFFKNKKYSKINKNKYKYIFISILSFIGLFISIKFISNHLLANLCFMIGILFAYFSIETNLKNNKETTTFFLLNLIWFGTYFIFDSLYPIKVSRYLIPLLPPFVYFVIWGLDKIIQYVKERFSFNLNIVPYILIIVFCLSIFMYIEPMTLDGHPNDLVNVANYLNEHDPNYHSKIIMGYQKHNNIIKWNLKETTIPVNPKNVNSIDSGNATYVILNKKKSFENYTKIYKSGEIYLYSRIN